jgi:hypothetical protein
MKKALALSAFALILTLPLASSAGTVFSNFLSTSSADGTLIDMIGGDTIQIEIAVQFDVDVPIDTFLFSLSADIDEVLVVGPPGGPSWATVQGDVTAWAWNFKAGGFSDVKMSTNGRITPATFTNQGAVQIGNGFIALPGLTGTGITNTIGTVTVTVGSSGGAFRAGGFEIPGTDGMAAGGVGQPFSFTTVDYTVVPEPGTAILMVLGLGGLSVMGRKSRK